MSDPSTYWLNVTNIVLGLVVLICWGAVVVSVFHEVAARRKRAAAMSKFDQEVADLVSSCGGHVFKVSGLGVTMADGGEELGKKDER